MIATLLCAPLALASLGAGAPQGTYLEARNASVFAGACHANGEYDHQGRAALVGWAIEAGEWHGVPLGGVRLAAAVRAAGNLAEGGARRSLVFVDAPDARTREAALAWLGERQGALLGTVLATRPTQLALFVGDGRFELTAGEAFALRGRLRADDACCSMPESVWYAPLDAAAGRRVGWSSRCRVIGADGFPGWTHEDANNAFAGRFGEAR